MIRKKKDCRLASIAAHSRFIPGEKGAPPGDAITVGLATPSRRQIMEQFCLPRSRVFVDHFARSRFVFVGLLVIPGLASKLLPKGNRLVGEPPGGHGVCLWVVAAIMALCKLWNSLAENMPLPALLPGIE